LIWGILPLMFYSAFRRYLQAMNIVKPITFAVVSANLLNFGGNWLLGPEGGRNGLMAAQGTNFDYVRADLEFGTIQFKDVGVRYKGNGTFWSSRDSLKRSFKVDFNQFVKGQKLAGVSTINLHNSMFDPTWMNEARSKARPSSRSSSGVRTRTVPGPSLLSCTLTSLRGRIAAPGRTDSKDRAVECPSPGPADPTPPRDPVDPRPPLRTWNDALLALRFYNRQPLRG
jgi:hypothetical protein